MRLGIIAVSLLALTAAAMAASEDEIMSTRYGNTLIIKDAFGTSKVYYNKDHTFTAASWVGDVSGTWKMENGKMCLYAVKYPFLYRLKYSIPECDVIDVKKVGEKWTVGSRNYELVQGIQK
jgi:hypothetical protein